MFAFDYGVNSVSEGQSIISNFLLTPCEIGFLGHGQSIISDFSLTS